VASYSSQRFSALLDFQRDVDLVYPSHIGKKNAPTALEGGFLAPGNQAKAYHHRARHGDNTSWQQNWSESLSVLLSSTFQRPAVAESPRSCAVEARATTTTTTKTLARSQGQFSAQKFIRNALKRAFARDEPVVNVKRARFEDFASTAEPMVCG
jgi:hypothetical protein